MPNVSSKLKFFLFADDTNIYFDSNDLKQLEFIMNKELKKFYNLLCTNRLSLNIKKTKFIVFHSSRNILNQSVTIKINNKAICETKYIKYLGILIDSNLSWKYHINELSKKISRTLGIMYKIRYFVNSNILINIYYAQNNFIICKR